jgi:hypothetical protein
MAKAKEFKESFLGALFKQDQLDIDKIDIIVDPRRASSDLSNYVDPTLAPGGHAIGYNPTNNPISTLIAEAKKIVNEIRNGCYYHGPPQSVLIIILVLAEEGDIKARKAVKKTIIPNNLLRYATLPIKGDTESNLCELYINKYSLKGDDERWKTFMISWLDGSKPIPENWKKLRDIIRCDNEGRIIFLNSCSIAMARKLYSRLKNHWNKVKILFERDMCEIKCLEPFPDKNPLSNYAHSCWRNRPSSISFNLSKQIPIEFKDIFEEINCSDKVMYNEIKKRKEIFLNWMNLLGKRHLGPTAWSDALSKFAKVINPYIRLLNTKNFKILEMCSFVPADLGREMFSRGKENILYFFDFGGGYSYYRYSSNWLKDAWLLLGTQYRPDKFIILDSLKKYPVGKSDINSQMIKESKILKINTVDICDYLRWYYFSGIWLEIDVI